MSESSGSPAIEVNNLLKIYPFEGSKGSVSKGFTAVDNVSFRLEEGEILGLLGPNGAGKTTTIQMLLGLTTPTAGEIKFFGKEFNSHREEILSKINFVSAYARMQEKMTTRQNLNVYGMIYQVKNLKKKIEELAEILEIPHLLDSALWTLSAGERTRANLAKGLINSPSVLLMDEPTASLDPDIVNKIIELIRKLQKEKKVSILFTSHNMEEVTRLCNRVIFLYDGKIEVEDTPQGLTKLVDDTKLILTYTEGKEKLIEYLKSQNLKYTLSGELIVEISLSEDRIPSVLFDLKKEGVWITDINIVKPTLEDVFLSFSRRKDVENMRGGANETT